MAAAMVKSGFTASLSPPHVYKDEFTYASEHDATGKKKAKPPVENPKRNPASLGRYLALELAITQDPSEPERDGGPPPQG